MSTLFGIFETGRSALLAQQTALAVTGNNIANVNTPGYSRQRANLVTARDIDVPPAISGTGVTVASIERIRSAFIDQQIRTEKSDLEFFNTMSDVIAQMETILSDPVALPSASIDDTPDSGLNATLIRFFDAWQELSLEPENTSVRASTKEAAITLAENFQLIDEQLTALNEDLNRQVEGAVDEINGLLDSIAEVNIQIAQLELEPTASANNLRDQRDFLITQLSELIPVDVEEMDSGAVNLRIAGISAVQASSTTHLIAVPRPNDILQRVDLSFDTDGAMVINEQVNSGKLGALISARETIVNDVRTQMDELASTLIFEVNKLHSGGTGLNGFESIRSLDTVSSSTAPLNSGAAGLDFDMTSGSLTIATRDGDGNVLSINEITFDPDMDSISDVINKINGTGQLSASLTASSQLLLTASSGEEIIFQADDTGFLAAMGINTFFQGNDAGTMEVTDAIQEDVTLIATSSDGNIGNNDVALSIAQLRTAQIMDSGSADFNEFYQSVVGTLGSTGQRIEQLVNSTDTLVQSLELQQESLAGVSLDEETVNMLKFQQAFNAASRFITAVDEMIDIVVSRMGLVGR